MSLAIRVAIIGGKKLAADMRRAAARVHGSELRRRTGQAAEVVTGAAVREISGSRTRSRFAIKGGKRVRRQKFRTVTAQGNRLGVFEGRLRQSIDNDVFKTLRGYDAEIGTAVVYAARHEFGKNMPKRPFMQPALDKTREQVVRLIGKTFKVIR